MRGVFSGPRTCLMINVSFSRHLAQDDVAFKPDLKWDSSSCRSTYLYLLDLEREYVTVWSKYCWRSKCHSAMLVPYQMTTLLLVVQRSLRKFLMQYKCSLHMPLFQLPSVSCQGIEASCLLLLPLLWDSSWESKWILPAAAAGDLRMTEYIVVVLHLFVKRQCLRGSINWESWWCPCPKRMLTRKCSSCTYCIRFCFVICQAATFELCWQFWQSTFCKSFFEAEIADR